MTLSSEGWLPRDRDQLWAQHSLKIEYGTTLPYINVTLQETVTKGCSKRRKRWEQRWMRTYATTMFHVLKSYTCIKERNLNVWNITASTLSKWRSRDQSGFQRTYWLVDTENIEKKYSQLLCDLNCSVHWILYLFCYRADCRNNEQMCSVYCPLPSMVLCSLVCLSMSN